MAPIGRNYWYGEVLPFVAMVAAECTTVGSSTVFKAAVSKGLSYHIFMLYSYAISALVLLPLSYIFHRKTQLPPLTVGIVFKFFLLGALGYTGQYLGNIGIALSSPTLGTAMSNLTPATTFILAVLFRMEKIEIRSSSSQAKITGTLVSIAGAFVVVLYNGPAVISRLTHDPPPVSISLHETSVQSNWVLGGVALAAEYIIVSVWYTYQAKVIKEYPAEMVLVLFYNVSCTILSLIDCFINEPHRNAWILEHDIRLISVIYAGTLGTGLSILVHTWGLHVKGPVYVALFLPMTIAIAAFMGVILLGDTLYLGWYIFSLFFFLIIISVDGRFLKELRRGHVAQPGSSYRTQVVFGSSSQSNVSYRCQPGKKPASIRSSPSRSPAAPFRQQLAKAAQAH